MESGASAGLDRPVHPLTVRFVHEADHLRVVEPVPLRDAKQFPAAFIPEHFAGQQIVVPSAQVSRLEGLAVLFGDLV